MRRLVAAETRLSNIANDSFARSARRHRVRHDDGVSLSRFWFEFDLEGHRPLVPSPGTRNLDRGTVQYRWLSFGAGVTGYDEEDALTLHRRRCRSAGKDLQRHGR